MKTTAQDFADLCHICKINGFYKRGYAFFRNHGDGVLQVLQYTKTSRPYAHVDLKIGLFSLYGELEPQWLTSSGCIPRYASHWLEPGIKESFYAVRSKRSQNMEDVRRVECYAINLPFIQDTLLPFLNQVQTQSQLAEAIMYLDAEASGPIKRDVMWLDELKIAPFLHSRNYESAHLVISTILNQHEIAKQWRFNNCSPKEYEEYITRLQIEDAAFHRVKFMIEEADYEGIEAYLRKNYQDNILLTSFLR